MSELKMVSPLLDQMVVERESPGHNGRTCYILRNTATGERFVLKRLSVPESDQQIRALILSGAYADEAAVHAYYGRVVDGIRAELEAGKKLAASGCFAGAVDYQVIAKESGVGFDVYILYPLNIPLSDFMAERAMTNLRAINLGIDLCDAISSCREAGYLFENVKPENIFFMTNGKFLLGDLGLVPLQDLRYASVPEEYIGPFSAPELSDITASPNTTIDLYALGMVLYRVYNANHGPFEDENTGEAMAEKLRLTGKPLPTPLYADYELAGIIMKACAFRPENRFRTPEDLKQALMLYMQRNEVKDDLIIPPIVTAAPVEETAQDEPETDEPMRMTDAEQLDDTFRKSFSPDLSGGGTEADVDETAVTPPVKPVPVKKPAEAAAEAQETPAAEAPAEQSEPPQEAVDDAPADSDAAASENAESGNGDDSAEEIDPDQMDLDSLLASVNEVMGEAPDADAEESPQDKPEEAEGETAATDHAYVDNDTDNAAEEEESDAPRRRTKVGLICALAALILGIGAIAYFLITWYFVDVTKLNVVSCSTEKLVVELITDDAQDCFVLTCKDSYGNVRVPARNGNQYTFSGLSADTTYFISVNAGQYHKLRNASAYNINVSTPEATEISAFTAKRGEKDGDVLLSFEYEGPAPDQWHLTYSGEADKTANSVDFKGNSCVISGLNKDELYTFTIEGNDTFFVSGQTSVQYELLPIVEVSGLAVTDIDNNVVSLSWSCGENKPKEWTVTCEANGDSYSWTTDKTALDIKMKDYSVAYTFTVTAGGLDDPATVVLPANPIVAHSLTAALGEDGSVTVTWDAPIAAPAGGWYVTYRPEGSLHAPAFAEVDTTQAVLPALIPGVTYEIGLALTPADSSSEILGETSTTVTTPSAGAFDLYAVRPRPPIGASESFIALFGKPDKETWDYRDLSDRRSNGNFTAGEEIAFCLEISSTNPSDDTVHLTYVVRDADGKAVNDVSRDLTWNEMWFERHHANAIPMPVKDETVIPGSYTFEIYVNGKLLASIGFTIG